MQRVRLSHLHLLVLVNIKIQAPRWFMRPLTHLLLSSQNQLLAAEDALHIVDLYKFKKVLTIQQALLNVMRSWSIAFRVLIHTHTSISVRMMYQWVTMIVRGFIEPIARELPMEYALELNRLIELQMEGAVG
jgi:hypothetical protein